jgi:heme/copper-type cytochrome/quinol oxidase subunit 2
MNKKAQASLEFSLVFVITLLFVVLTVNVFAWLNHTMVGRQRAYEDTRSEAGSTEGTTFFGLITTRPGDPGRNDFYERPPLNVFSPGGVEE